MKDSSRQRTDVVAFLRSSTAIAGVTVAVIALATLWLWINGCRFPASHWNDLRLTAVFMAAEGVPVYNLPERGVLSTWMYGPTPLWLWSPALLARDAATALMSAAAANIFLSLAAIAAACRWWPVPGARPIDRLLAAALCCLLWPEATFRFLQADNVVVAGGLISLLALARHEVTPHRGLPWLAAIATALALGAKQTAVGLPAAQLLWVWHLHGARRAGAQLVRTGVAGVVFGALAVQQFGLRELWFSAVTVPSRLPWADDLGQRAVEIWPYVTAQWVLPAAVLLALRRQLREFAPSLRLPVYAWICTLPLGIAGMLTSGGSHNHLQGFQLLSPAALVAVLAAARSWSSLAPVLAGVAGLVIGCGKIAVADHAPLQPNLRTVHAASMLQRGQPGAVWLPWSPLVTYFAEGRFDHTEDGIYVRFITGHPVSLTHARAHLPPRLRVIMLPTASWGVAELLAPQSSREGKIAHWRVLHWEPERTEQ